MNMRLPTPWMLLFLLAAVCCPVGLLSARTASPAGSGTKVDPRTAALRGAFRVAETFDDLQDWSAGGRSPSGADDPAGYDPLLLPRRSDGGPSLWGYWANKGPTCLVRMKSGSFQKGETVTGQLGGELVYEKSWLLEGNTYLQFSTTPAKGSFRPGDLLTGERSGAEAEMIGWPMIIANHGEYSLGGRGKSLMMNLGDNDNPQEAMKGIGAQRLGFFFGDGVSGRSGLRKVHLFMMLRFKPNFFPESGGGNFAWLGFLKMWDMCPGFTAINHFGTSVEREEVSADPQNRAEYGAAGGTLVQLAGGGKSTGSRIFFDTLQSGSVLREGRWRYENGDKYRMSGAGGDNDIQEFYRRGQWFAVEYALDMGSPGHRDGSIDFWVYDADGRERGHFSASGLRNSTHYDHWINKIVLGGNRRSSSKLTSGTDGRFFIDDVIVDSGRIGPRYFEITRRFRPEASGGESGGGHGTGKKG
ncbi:hypothetical protein [Geomonas sp.]|uniref:hypothetical protein n=1 Tax=Geomonas sp. TaxID=2651584 RepID=UPI002B4A3809|nr:hypothetical protein [Geomonas sp.]HJV36212.1 hypothetical protein [Geomonas sp.]